MVIFWCMIKDGIIHITSFKSIFMFLHSGLPISSHLTYIPSLPLFIRYKSVLLITLPNSTPPPPCRQSVIILYSCLFVWCFYVAWNQWLFSNGTNSLTRLANHVESELLSPEIHTSDPAVEWTRTVQLSLEPRAIKTGCAPYPMVEHQRGCYFVSPPPPPTPTHTHRSLYESPTLPRMVWSFFHQVCV